MLFDVVSFVGRRQHLGLIDVIHTQRLEDLRLDEMADAHLRHHGDRHSLHDPHDDLRI